MSEQQAITPYRSDRAGRRWRPLSLGFMLIYCGVTGAAVALLPAQLLFLLAIPLFLAVPTILWLMPDGGRVPERLLATLLVWFIAANALWPNYLSIDLPGLPWINPPRIIVFALLTVALYSFSTSSKVRQELAEILRAIPVVRIAFWVFWGMTALTIALSAQPVFSLNKWANNQIFWTFMFFLSAWLATRPGVMGRVVTVVTWTTILIALDTIYEFHIQQVPWMDHIPSFLKVDDAYLANVLKSQSRAGTDIYRARGTFAVSLICAEYMAIVYPFLIHKMVTAQGLFQRSVLFMGLVAVLSAMWLTNARSAMIGFFLAVFMYAGFAAYRYWRRNRTSLVGVSTIAAVPVLAVAFFVLALTWPRLHNMTFGGGQHQPSTEARSAQWSMGTPKVKANPIGHGAAQGGVVLGYANGAGQLTIDTYYLSLLLEYGVVGFVAFLTMFGGQLIYGLRMYLSALSEDESLAGPTAIALFNFLIIKSVLSSEFNVPIAYIFLGFLFAIALRQQQRLGGTRALPAAAPAAAGRLAAA